MPRTRDEFRVIYLRLRRFQPPSRFAYQATFHEPVDKDINKL